jgi:hypothetical protein
MSVIRRDDDPVAVWVDDCGRSWVAAQTYATALEQRDEAWQEIERLSTNHRGAVEALREIDTVCSFGADREGMTAMGVQAVRRIAQRGLGGQ